MEQNMRFELISNWLTILKKNMDDYEQLLRPVFSCFRGQKMAFKKKYCSVRTKNLDSIFFFNFFGKKHAKYSQSIVYCSTRDTFQHDFYTMTLIILYMYL